MGEAREPFDGAAERRLVRRMLAGDREAFEGFFVRHAPAVYRYALARLGGDVECAQEVAQATLCTAMGRLTGYRGDGPLVAWLYGICRFELAAAGRRAARAAAHGELLEEDPRAVAAAPPPTPGWGPPDDEVQRRQVAAHVHATLDALPPRYADVLEWKYLDGLPVNDIAARLGLTPKAAESLLTRARIAFRRDFTGRQPSPTMGKDLS